ncbi:MAG: hypothetical protein GKS01_19550 [Alphaproteobacteria bacterium]|nr:hypothetical protein [Alphaproteobacteria bacterium]
MRRHFFAFSCAVALLLPLGSAKAVVIQFTSAAMVPFVGGSTGQTLENQMNSLILNPQGVGVEFGATDGGTSAVDHMQFEGPAATGGLVVISGFGAIIRFDTAVSNVRVQFSNHKDDGVRTVYAFDQDVDFTRSTTAFNQHSQGNPLGIPDTNLAIDMATGTLPSGSTGLMDLTVSGSISALWLDTNFFLTSLREIEFDTAQASEPGSIAIFGLAVFGLGVARRQKKKPA